MVPASAPATISAVAQAQRLQAETDDPDARARAAEIEATLKRLTRLSERLMQLARAEGGRLRRDRVADLRPVARIVVDDLSRATDEGRIALTLPDLPVLAEQIPMMFDLCSSPRVGGKISASHGRSSFGWLDIHLPSPLPKGDMQ